MNALKISGFLFLFGGFLVWLGIFGNFPYCLGGEVLGLCIGVPIALNGIIGIAIGLTGTVLLAIAYLKVKVIG